MKTTFHLIRSRRDPEQLSLIMRLPETGQVFEAALFGISVRTILEQFDFQVDEANSGETFEAITLTKKPATAPEKQPEQ